MNVTPRTRLTARVPKGRARRAALIGTAALMTGGLATGVAQVAGAQPQPSISSVQKQIDDLTGQFNKANQQYDQVEEQLSAAQTRLKQINKELAANQAKYKAARNQVVQIAATDYEDGPQTSLAGLLTSNDPSQVLAQASIVMQLTGNRNLQTQAFLRQAAQLASIQSEQQHTLTGIKQLASQKSGTKDKIEKLLAHQKSILATLTEQQAATVQGNTVGGSGGITSAVYTGTTATQAGKAVAFAFGQLGCIYVYGGTGPCGSGFDCSGLVMKSWAAAGVSIPRDTYSQWAALPHVSSSSLQPGDLLFYNGIGHVAMYVGGGMMIDAPTPGETIRELPMNTAWYATSFDGAARP